MTYHSKIVTSEYPILRVTSTPVKIFDKKLVQLLDHMRKILHGTEYGVAIAAPQIAVSKRVVVIAYENEYLELINPVYITKSEDELMDTESCLSIPGVDGKVKRHREVSISYMDRYGIEHTITRSGNMARCIQHELDHLDGILFTDKLS